MKSDLTAMRADKCSGKARPSRRFAYAESGIVVQKIIGCSLTTVVTDFIWLDGVKSSDAGLHADSRREPDNVPPNEAWH